MVDFIDVLGKIAAEVEKPKPKPVGTYLAVIFGLPKQRQVEPKGGGEMMPVMAFTCKLIAPQDDVNTEQLADLPPIEEWAGFQHDMFLHTEGGVWAFTNFLTDVLGIEQGSKTLGEMCAEAAGKNLLVKLKHTPFINKQNEADIRTEIDSVAKI